MTIKKFIRKHRLVSSKKGQVRKTKERYRRAKGRHNKIREKHAGKPVNVEIGYRTKKETRGLIDGKKTILVNTIADLMKVKEELVIIGNIGNKKKAEIAKKADEKKIKILNLNVKKFLKKIENKKAYDEKIKAEKRTKKEKKADVKKPEVKKVEDKENKVEENKV